MDTAKITETNEIISSIDLSMMNEQLIEQLNYQCPECSIGLTPASYRLQNIRAPYFTPANRNNYHHDDCLYNEKKGNLKKYQTTNYGSVDEIPFKFPNGLNLSEPGAGTPRGPGPNPPETPQQHYQASSLFAICKTFSLFPLARKLMPLRINNITGDTYQSCFQRIQFDAVNQNNRILFGLSSWNSLSISDQTISISLLAWNNSTSSSDKISIQIDCQLWSELTKKSFIKEFNEASETAKESYQKKSKMRTWIFFIGTQSADDLNLFHLSNRKLISILHTNLSN